MGIAPGVGGCRNTGAGAGMQRKESASDSLAAMLGPGLQGSVDGGVAAAAVVVPGVGQKRPLFEAIYDGPTVEDGPELDGDDELVSPGGSPLEKKRRLTSDQVRSLERNFEMENKLEPERKMQLAKDLGLRPRQVAVWFQNRRARWKTKQLERDYETLASDFERLKAEYEELVGEKNHLKAEVQRLVGATPGLATDGVATSPLEPEAGECVRHHYLHNARSPPTVLDVSFKEEASACTDGSNSSDVLDADSPRTSDSCSPASGSSEHATTLQQRPEFPPPESCCFAAPGMLPDLPTSALNSDAFHEVDQSCNYLLHLDEQSVLPWWDWP